MHCDLYTIVYTALFKYIFEARQNSDISEQEPYEFYFAKTDSSTYRELDISEKELYSNVKEKTDVENVNIFDLLEWRFDFENLDQYSNFNLHYNNEPSLAKIEHFRATPVKGRCLLRNIYNLSV